MTFCLLILFQHEFLPYEQFWHWNFDASACLSHSGRNENRNTVCFKLFVILRISAGFSQIDDCHIDYPRMTSALLGITDGGTSTFVLDVIHSFRFYGYFH